MSKRFVLIALFAVFFAPVLVSVLLHSQWLDWRPESTRNHGTLIQPPVALAELLPAAEAGGGRVTLDGLREDWQLMHVTAECGEECFERLYWLRQVRRAQDRHQPEISLLLVSARAMEAETVSTARELVPGLRIIAGADGERLLAGMPVPETARSYIVDPGGNIILSYDAGADPNGIRKDLRRLLTWTQRD